MQLYLKLRKESGIAFGPGRQAALANQPAETPVKSFGNAVVSATASQP